jgi:hypothetical protein
VLPRETRHRAWLGSAKRLPNSRYGPHKRGDAIKDELTVERVAVSAVAMPDAVSKGAPRLATIFRL